MTVTENLDVNTSENELVDLLKRRMQNDVDQETLDDTYLFYRFLKARNFNLNQAEIMLKKHLHWRKINQIDTIITDYQPLEVLEKYFPISKFGVSKEDSICRYVPLGVIDSKGLQASGNYLDLEKFFVKMLEIDERLLKEKCKMKGAELPEYIYVFNMQDMPYSLAVDKKGIQILIRLFKMYQDNYPERLKAVYFLNVPSYFILAFSIIKAFLAPSIIEKIHMCGSDGWKEQLLKVIDADQLPAFLGGKKTDPDSNPLCKTFINHGMIVPESYYLKNNIKLLSKNPESKKIFLARASYSEICLEVDQYGSVIEWQFESKPTDIAFGLFFKENLEHNVKLVELIPIERIITKDVLGKGSYRCDKSGIYVLYFDNSFSWMKSKEVFYQATVKSPLN